MSAQSVTKMTGQRAKGANPHFFDDANIDRLLTMMMDMAAEISVLRERLDTHERVAAAKGAYTPADIEAYEPSDDVRAARDAWRNKFLDRLLTTLEQDYDKGLG
jgi:hypothetical protein